MSNGKFSKPRPYRDEEREIEQAFRAITGQTPPPEPQPRVEDYQPPIEALEDYLPTQPEVAEEPFPELDLSDISDETEYEGEYAADEPDFFDKLQLYAKKAAELWKKNPKAILVSLCALALVVILGFMAAFLFGPSDPYGGKILQNVYIAGVNVGGLSKNDAVTAVKQAAITYSQQDMVIDLSGTELRLTPAQTKIQLDAKAAVGEAYRYGRSGSKQEQEAAYLASLSQNHYVNLIPYLKADEPYIRAALNSCVSGGGTLKQTNYGMEGAQPLWMWTSLTKMPPARHWSSPWVPPAWALIPTPSSPRSWRPTAWPASWWRWKTWSPSPSRILWIWRRSTKNSM